MTDVAGDALGRGAEGREGVGDAQVDLAGVGLGGDGVDAAEAGFLSYVLDLLEIQVPDLRTASDRGKTPR